MFKATGHLALIVLLTACQPDVEPDAAQAPTIDSAQAAADQAQPSRVDQTESERLNTWFDEKFEQRLQMNPAWLTQLGRKDRYDEYDDMSEAAADRQLLWLDETVQELNSDFAYDQLDLEARTSDDLWNDQ